MDNSDDQMEFLLEKRTFFEKALFTERDLHRRVAIMALLGRIERALAILRGNDPLVS